LPFEDQKTLLRDIHQSIALIEEFVRGMDLPTYRRDAKTQAAVERMVLIISEAAVRLKDDAERLCPGVPWRDIRGIGNWLRHGYDRIDAEVIWDTIRVDLLPLKDSVERALAFGEPSAKG
jgi:uncharacterized protein with HEPN domain